MQVCVGQQRLLPQKLPANPPLCCSVCCAHPYGVLLNTRMHAKFAFTVLLIIVDLVSLYCDLVLDG